MNIPAIRLYENSDYPAIRDICMQTALYGRPISSFLAETDLIAEGLLGYYTRFERESLFVAEADGKIAGYLTGCRDTRICERISSRHIAPRLAWLFFARGHWHTFASYQIAIALLHKIFHEIRLMRKIIPAYPAHCHLNVATGTRRGGIGAALLGAFLDFLEESGVPGIHVSTPTDPGKSFFSKMGFVTLAMHRAIPLGGAAPGEIWIMGKKLKTAT